MDEFVNPKKRGFLLPYGMKDLIDVLRRKPGASAQHASALPFGLAGGHAETIWDVVPMPDRQDHLVALIQRMFELACHLSQDAIVECLRLDAEHPGS